MKDYAAERSTAKDHGWGRVAWVGLWVVLLACDRSPPDQGAPPEPAAVAPAPPVVVDVEPLSQCEKLAADLAMREPAHPGTPLLDLHRAEVLARARAVPVIFMRAPRQDAGISASARAFRERLRESQYPEEVIQEALRKTRGNHAERRAIFLSEQYLYAETPLLALRLSQMIRLDHLFSEPELVIESGERTMRVERVNGRYFLADEPTVPGNDPPETQGLAGLLLFDRVRATTQTFGPRLHLDLTQARRDLGFAGATIQTFTQRHLILTLNTLGVKSLAVFALELQPVSHSSKRELARLEQGAQPDLESRSGQHDGSAHRPRKAAQPHPAVEDAFSFLSTKPTLSCESVLPPHTEAELSQARKNATLDRQLIEPVLSAAREMVALRLPFDEPRTEEGQQDGFLRLHFKEAYRRYRDTYEFNGDSYYVFDTHGRVRLPQVCIDFITDAFDWGTGGRWPERGEKRLQVKGALHFSALGIENARSVESLAAYATATPAWFDMIWFDKSERVRFLDRERFFRSVKDRVHLYRAGDVVFIYGLRDDGKFHYHSFLIDELDPLSGMPMLLLANAGPPQARSWEGEMQNAPQRAIVARMRVRREVLAAAHEWAKVHPGVPMPAPRTEYTLENRAQLADGLSDLPEL